MTGNDTSLRLPALLGVGDTAASVMIDSGATSLFMDTAVARRCGAVLRPSNRVIRLADGTERPVDGTALIKCRLTSPDHAGAAFEAEYCVAPLGGHEVILGIPWLRHFNPQIDWRERRIQLRRGEGFGLVAADSHSTEGVEFIALRAMRARSEAEEHIEDEGPEQQRRKSVECCAVTHSSMQKLFRRGKLDLASVELIRVRIASDGATSLGAATAKTPLDPELAELLAANKDLMPAELPPTDTTLQRGVKHHIELTPGAKPHAPPLRRYSPVEDAEIRKQVEAQLAKGQVRPSTSPWGAMVLLAKKKDGGLRFCVDYRALNNQTVKDRYALPLADDCFDRAQGARFFSKLDLHSGFWQIQLSEESAPLTAFRTRFGHFEYTVLPMGLCNAPATFMRLMNDVLRKHLDEFVLAFLDDIFIYSKTRDEHLEHLRKVLSILREQKLYLKPSKCEWMQEEVEFLGHRIGRNGLSVDPSKVDAVQQWPIPSDVSQLRSFLGLAGYYRRFIEQYGKLTLPLTELMKDEVPWTWASEQQHAFEELKRRLSSAPVLRLADPSKPYVIHCDASGFAAGAVLMQDQGQGLQPVSFISTKMKPAETRYAPHEQELLALVYACRKWRHYLHGRPFTILSDHRSLRYFATQPLLSARQARWKDLLAEFDFTIQYIEGPKNVVADALSRRIDHQPASLQEMLQQRKSDSKSKDEFLATIRFRDELEAPQLAEKANPGRPSPCQLCALMALSQATTKHHLRAEATSPANPTMMMQDRDCTAATVTVEQFHLLDELRTAAEQDEEYQRGLKAPSKVFGNGCEVRGGLAWFGARLCIPNDLKLRTRLLMECHDTPSGGHFGRDKTLQALRKRFHWSGMTTQVASYVATCDTCQRIKHSQQKTPGLLMPLPVPEDIDSHWTMDFISGLPKTERGHDAIQGHFSRGGSIKRLTAARTTDTAADIAQRFIDHVVRHHGFPASVVSDRDPRMIKGFWAALMRRMRTVLSRSTSHHAQSDGKSERDQRTLEQWLRAFCAERPRDWDLQLSLAELALNSTPSASSGITPYKLLYGRDPALIVDRAFQAADDTQPVDNNPVPAAEARWKMMKLTWTAVRKQLLVTQRRMIKQADRHRRATSYKEGDMVLLSTEHLKLRDAATTRKLSHLFCGPFPVKRVVNRNAYELELPKHLQIHPVINIGHLRPYRDGSAAFPDRPPPQERPPPDAVDSDGVERYVVERVLAQRGTGRRRQYLVLWQGYGFEEASWEPAANLVGAEKHVSDFLKLVRQRPSRRSKAQRKKGQGRTDPRRSDRNKSDKEPHEQSDGRLEDQAGSFVGGDVTGADDAQGSDSEQDESDVSEQ